MSTRILYDFHLVGPAGGGVSVVCYTFAREFVQRYPEHTCYAILDADVRRSFVRLGRADANLAVLDDLVGRRELQDAAEPTGLSGMRRIYRHSRVCWPLRASWRLLMSQQRKVNQLVEPARLNRSRRILDRHCAESGIEVIHCPFQWIRPQPPQNLAHIPYVMNMHDLQHEHFPEFFSEQELRFRRSVWYASARASRFVVAAAAHVKADIVKHVGIHPDRVPVIPWGALSDREPAPSSAVLDSVAERFGLPERFLLYPAIMWEHKNHLGLLKALLKLKQDGVHVNVVFTGGTGPLEHRVKQFVLCRGLKDWVRHLGFVSREELTALYKLAAGVVVPSLHEQTSGPLIEAQSLGCPAAAGRIADHEELAAERCALLFDPTDVADIAQAVRILWQQPDDCAAMARRASKRIREIRSWQSWARGYNDLYEMCAEERKQQKRDGKETGERRS